MKGTIMAIGRWDSEKPSSFFGSRVRYIPERLATREGKPCDHLRHRTGVRANFVRVPSLWFVAQSAVSTGRRGPGPVRQSWRRHVGRSGIGSRLFGFLSACAGCAVRQIQRVSQLNQPDRPSARGASGAFRVSPALGRFRLPQRALA